MFFSFLDTTNIFDRYTDAKLYTDSLTDGFPEHERLANNKPHPGIDPAYPKTTDGTTASIIRKTPRRVIQQLPTGVVTSDAEDWLSIVAGFIYTHKIIPFANEEYDLIQKSWTVVEKGLTFGSCGTYSPFLDHDGYLCPDLTIPYWGDLMLQRGKKSGYSCKYVFMRSWWQTEDMESLITNESKAAKKAKKSGTTYEPTWDVAALRKVKTFLTQKDKQATTPTEENQATNTKGAVELITGFQVGVGAEFFTFHNASKTIVRTKVNKDPRGRMPIDWMYGDIDGSNPLGRGIPELVGPLQNLIDADMQMYQFNRALMLAPPVIKKGNFNKNKIKYVPNAIIDLGSDPSASVEPLTIDTTAVANYPQLYGLQKSQLLNLTASPDTSISADVGNPGFSKTPAGVNSQNAIVSVDDNYVRKMFEAWFENWSETAINLYFAERTGIEELQLDKDTADKLRKLAQEDKFDLATLTADNKIRIDFTTATPALKFKVDASTSKMKDDQKQLQGLELLQTSLDNSPIFQQIVPPEKQIGLWNSLVGVSGVENPEELKIDVEEFKQKQALAQQQQAAMAQAPQMQPPMQDPGLGMPPPEQTQQPPMAPPPTQFSPEDQQLIDALKQMGADDNQIGQALAMLHSGQYTEQHILEMLMGGQNG